MKRTDWELAFARRFERHEEELRWLFMELYHNDLRAYDDFTEMLYRLYEERPEDLRRMDEAREADPDWYRGHKSLGMQMYVGAFAKTLRGVMEKLDYITECGVTYLHLMPLLCSPEGRSDGGYAVSDFRRVEPRFGTMDDLSDLSAACHERGISVCLDFVMNHTSEDHEWAKRARAGEKAYQDRYFFYDSWEIPNAYEQTVPQVFPTTAPGNFSWCEEAGKVVMTTFYPYQWDLNYANPAVFIDMTDNMMNLANHGIDVIRLDAVPYIWKALGTTCRNLRQVHTLVRMMRIACEIVCPGTLLLGEVVMEPSKVAPYFGTVEKPECHMLYNVTTMASIWHTAAVRDVRLLAHQLSQIIALPRSMTFLNYLRCHDDIGWGLDYDFLSQFGMEEAAHKKYLNDYFTGKWPGSPSRGELYNDDPRLKDARLCGTTASLCGLETARIANDKAAIRDAVRFDLMLHAFMFTLSGTPVLYSGDEVAQENDNAYHDDPLKADDSRYLHRGNFDWRRAGRRHMKNTVPGRIFGGIMKMKELRKEHRVFDADADMWLLETGNIKVLGIGRYYQGEKLLAFFNFSDREEVARVPDIDRYEDLMSGGMVDGAAVSIPAGGFLWLRKEF